MVDFAFCTIGRANCIQVKCILDTRLAGYVELLAVCTPEWSTKILVLGFVEIGPNNWGSVNGGKADAHLRVLFTSFGIMGAAKCAVLAEGRVDGEHGHFCIVKTVKGQGLAVRGPPEGAIPGRTAENLLIIHPTGVAVHDGFRAVEGEAGLFAGGDIGNPKVIGAGEGQLGGVRAVGQVHRSFWLQGEIGKLFRELKVLGLCPLFAFYAYCKGIIERSVVGKCNLVICHPLEIDR